MPIDRVFLGWTEPCLPKAAKWLRDRYQRTSVDSGACDMSGVVLVLPGARAGRRLLELLCEPGGVFVPPRIVTVGSLPELLHAPASPVADPLTALLAMVHALRSIDRALLAAIVPQPPEENDLLGWLALAREIEKLREDLAGERVTFGDVIAHGRKQVEFTDEPRWQALSAIEQTYERCLAGRGQRDRHAARAEAIASRSCRSELHIVLIGATDLPRVARAMLEQVADRVTVLVQAPKSEAEGFDDLGCVRPDAWTERPIAVPDDIIHIADRPRDQAMDALTIIGELAGERSADEITLGVGDETMMPMLQRTLDLAEVPAHAPITGPVAQSRPATLLSALAKFSASGRLDDFAALLRHSDLEAYLRAHDRAGGARHWLTLLDGYVSDHLLARSAGEWLGVNEKGVARAARLKEVFAAVTDLLPDRHETRPLPAWSERIADLLARIYEAQPLDRRCSQDLSLIHAIEAVAAALREQATIRADDALAPPLSFSAAVRFTLARLAETEVAAQGEPSGAAVELLGWLELALDDAPALIITGFNEHHIPQSGGLDAFLPDSLRRALGLMDNRRRYARDAALFTAILHSKQSLVLIAGRRGHDDEPLKPSRLLLTGDAAELAHRILRFYPKDPAEGAPPEHHALLPVGGTNRFVIPAPVPPKTPVDSFRVTWFKTYLDCPYRFYLKHVLGLGALDDEAIEMSPLHFGNLAHEVLNQFGQSPLRDSPDEKEIKAFFDATLDAVARSSFGAHPPVPVAVQVAQLRDRLAALAAWQARQPGEGWSINPDWLEKPVTATLEIGGAKVKVHGRIDRIDVHRDGRRRVLDYKTGDKGDPPDKTHRSGRDGAKEWIDLQLPLYAQLVGELGITGAIELGYVLLPKKLEEVGCAMAPWTGAELAEAMAKVEDVVRAVRAGVFWPPRDAGGFEDEFTPMCLESYRGRLEVIRQVTEAIKARG